jgi:hypothetical protein
MMMFDFDDDVWRWCCSCLTMMLFRIDDDVDYDLFMMVEYEVVMIKMLWLKGYMIMLMTNICRYVMIFIWWYDTKYMTNIGRIVTLVKEV